MEQEEREQEEREQEMVKQEENDKASYPVPLVVGDAPVVQSHWTMNSHAMMKKPDAYQIAVFHKQNADSS